MKKIDRESIDLAIMALENSAEIIRFYLSGPDAYDIRQLESSEDMAVDGDKAVSINLDAIDKLRSLK